jgi:type III secretion system YscQ/HrcQ family protein
MLDRASPVSRDSFRRPQLDTLSAATCGALNAIHRIGGLAPLQLGARTVRLAPRWQAQPVRVADPVSIGLRIDDEAGELIVPEKLLDRVLADLEPNLRLASLSDEFRPILVEYALRGAFDALERGTGCRLSVDAVRQGRAPSADSRLGTAQFIADLHDFGQAPCLLRLPAAQFARLAGHLGGLAEKAPPRIDLPLPVRLRWGRVELTLAELRSLQAGDIVMLDQTCRQPGIALAVIGEHLIAPVELLRTGYRLTGQPQRAAKGGGEWALDRQSAETRRLSDAQGIDDIPLSVFIEFGLLELDRSAVAALRSGSQLPLARPLEAGLDIVAAGTRIGTGEVTMIGDAPALRITRLAR